MRMMPFFLGPLVLVLAWAADTGPTAVVSAANPGVGVAPDSLATVYGDHLASQTALAVALPWPVSLGDIPGVSITDSASKSQVASLVYVSPSQMNLWIPPGTAAGPATLSFPATELPPGAGTAALRTVPVIIQKVAPGLFSVDAQGTAAATAIRIVIPTGIQSPVPVFTCGASGNCTTVPIDVGTDAPVYLSLYGTGIRGAGSLSNVSVTIGNTSIQPLYVGPQPQFPGLDQVNVPLVLSLRGSGLVNVTVTANGVSSNAVRINIR